MAFPFRSTRPTNLGLLVNAQQTMLSGPLNPCGTTTMGALLERVARLRYEELSPLAYSTATARRRCFDPKHPLTGGSAPVTLGRRGGSTFRESRLRAERMNEPPIAEGQLRWGITRTGGAATSR